MSNHDEFDWEPTPGLPARLPLGENIVWQGSPHWWQLAQHAFHVNKIALYFAIMVFLDFFSVYKTGITADAVMSGPALTLLLSIAALSILIGLAWLTSTVTIYTLTNKRILIRFGIAIQLTLDIPLSQIVSADMTQKRRGHGDIALTLVKKKRTSYFVLWPHVRPWRFGHPQPMLRSIPNVESVALQLGKVAAKELDLSESQTPSEPQFTNNAVLPMHHTPNALKTELNKELGAS